MATGTTERERAKASRQAALLREAARLFAEHGFNGVSLEDLGTAVGVSGPAIYRHFANKQAVLGAVLTDVSRSLRDGGLAVVEEDGHPHDVLGHLVDFHVDFALGGADVIRVQDRDLQSLSEEDRHTVRRLQREYVELWVQVLERIHPQLPEQALRVRAHAAFGLINSTPHSVRALHPPPAEDEVRATLTAMALASLRA
ncbi:MAG: TetR/AcrR family transcriptional regulator [Gemmatimonadota bacterium]|nr:TetR/AcrR family transcriptional regulator [Gemmatimonadota bacterium]